MGIIVKNGIEYGGGGSSNLINKAHLIKLQPGDGTTSRTFELEQKPSFISLSWFEGTGGTEWATHYSFNWGDPRAYGLSGQTDLSVQNQYFKVARITYGADKKSFTLTATNAGSACNSSGEDHYGYLVWMEDTSKSSNSHQYSTEEQIVDTWVDGRPIYEKIYFFTQTSTSTGILLSDIIGLTRDQIGFFKLEWHDMQTDNNASTHEYFHASDDFYSWYYETASGKIIFRSGESWPKRPFNSYVLCQYTKLSDPATNN